MIRIEIRAILESLITLRPPVVGSMNSLLSRSGQRPFARQPLYRPAYAMETTARFCIGGCNVSGDGEICRVRTAVRMCNTFCTHMQVCLLDSAPRVVIFGH
jgi:hypothetical protein